jgi:hypothetical protein
MAGVEEYLASLGTGRSVLSRECRGDEDSAGRERFGAGDRRRGLAVGLLESLTGMSRDARWNGAHEEERDECCRSPVYCRGSHSAPGQQCIPSEPAL